MRRSLFLSLLLCLTSAILIGQTARISGVVRDNNRQSIPNATVFILRDNLSTLSDEQGRYSLEVPADRPIIIQSTYPGYRPFNKEVTLSAGEEKEVNVVLRITDIGEVRIVDQASRTQVMERISPKLQRVIPNPVGGIESLVISQLGVSSTNELSSNYNVRGGSFDENLVYVNDIEVYRPFLSRSGQQEGLSFANPNMVSDILFSAGGFDAKYGDKMSSVLDIQYARPTQAEGSFTAGFLGGDLHYGNLSKNKRLTHITGFRYKSNAYLLGSLDEQGDYNTRFLDLQNYSTYAITDTWDLEFLGNIASNRYNFIPTDRQTQLGSINEALQLTVFFEGQEITQYETYFGALSLSHKPRKNINLKFITSAFQTKETEDFDILGQYRLDELDRDLGSEGFGEVINNIGVGGYLDHARNRLDATVLNFSHKGLLIAEKHTVQWGAGIRSEVIDDRLSEWGYIDSAGYSLPYTGNGPIVLDDRIKARNSIESARLQAFVQDNYTWLGKDSSSWDATLGLRAQHWTFSNETLISPRGRISWAPKWYKAVGDSLIKRDVVFKAAGGLYYQPAFYREMRTFDGDINEDITAQQSIHAVVGADMMIKMFDRPFRLITEAYYKHYNSLTPYEIENVRLRYFADQIANGFAYGIDTKLNGEFIPGVESWASLSYLKTREDIVGDSYDLELEDGSTSTLFPGNIPRPTDQRVNFSMFFQDEMPLNKSYKVQLSLHWGTGLPYGPPDNNRFRDTLRTPSYRRVDIGFTKQFIDSDTEFKNPTGFFANFKEAWVALEVFNLLNIPNVQSFLWVKDVRGRQYPVPNFLTPRRLNLKIYFRF